MTDWHWPILVTVGVVLLGIAALFALGRITGTWRRFERRERRDERREDQP